MDDDDDDDDDGFIKFGKRNANLAYLLSYFTHCSRLQTSNGFVHCTQQQSQRSKWQIKNTPSPITANAHVLLHTEKHAFVLSIALIPYILT
jgi:hypothetical protein